jgi:short-subunit dehydrogenase
MKPAQARVLLTGAAGGIGQATALALLRAGASVLLVGRTEHTLAESARALIAQGFAASRVKWHRADLTQPHDLQRLVDESARLGCNVLIHAAGLPAFGALAQWSATEVRAVLQTNLEAPMLLTQALLPQFMALPRAQIICVGSALGRMGLPGFSVYSASKFGLLGFAEALRRELADSPVRVQYLGPRSTRTRFNNAAVSAYNRSTGTHEDPPEVVAEAIVHMLTSETAERFLGFPEKLAVRLNALAPAWFDRVFRRHAAHLRDSHIPQPLAAPASASATTQSPASARPPTRHVADL